ncbi:hypothetical protein GQ44DRAFT_740499 [Phaeosphaeriaceae sp. PMI808]|nr:hypothetical protein GQ44DRAFT_740499 [Phaeosphaeriaceae sp. PMI808]
MRSVLGWTCIHWKFQILSWTSSLCFFVATVAVLRVLEGQPLPDLRNGITPNAIIGLLATFTEFLLIIPVNSAFGQLKWLDALQTRPMDDFRAIDEASRGPWGSLKLLVRRIGGLAASFGALVTIFALGIGTFTQQTLRYETIYPFSEGALLPVAKSFSSGITGTASGQGVSSDYLYQDPPQTKFVPKPFETLAKCSNKEYYNCSKPWVNTSDACYSDHYRLPKYNFGLAGGLNHGSKIFSIFPNSNLSIADTERKAFAPPLAYECMLQYCIRTTEISTFIDPRVIKQTIVGHYVSVEGIFIKSPRSSEVFGIDSHSTFSLQSVLSSLLVGDATVNPPVTGIKPTYFPNTSSFIHQAFYSAMLASDSGFPDLIDNLARSLSLHLRMTRYPTNVEGRQYWSTTRAVVRWPWLIFPALELLGGLAFLVAVMVGSRKAGVSPWTNNVLAYFFHGLEVRAPKGEMLRSNNSMEKEAKKLMLKFRPREGGGGGNW